MKDERREELREYARGKLRHVSGMIDQLGWRTPDPNVTMVMRMSDAHLIHYCRVQKMIDKGVYQPPK